MRALLLLLSVSPALGACAEAQANTRVARRSHAFDAGVTRSTALPGPWASRTPAGTLASRASITTETVTDAEETETETETETTLTMQTCRPWHSARGTESPLRTCPTATERRVVRWNPDALVVLGGGLRRDGQPNCATAQRGFIAAQMFTALEGAPALVFTGHASRWIRRRVDESDVRCVRARMAQGPLDESAPRWARELRAPSPGEAFSMSEAESMCAVVLRAVAPSMRERVLDRARFDVRAGDTVQNARFTRGFLVDERAERVLLLSSPFVNPSTGKRYPHADRALSAFRRARNGAQYALAGVACGRRRGSLPYFYFDPTAENPEPQRSRALTADEAALEVE